MILPACGADNVEEQVLENSASVNEITEENETSEEIETTEEISVNTGEPEEISGTLSFYTSQPDADAVALADGFKAKYENVDVEIFRSGTEEVISKLLAEEEAGAVQADVLLVADAVTFEGLKEKGLLLSYESPELNAIPDEFVDVDNMYSGTKIMSTIMAVNTNMVDEMPTSWSALTSEEALNEVIMPSPLYSGAAAYNAGVFSRTKDFGWEFYEDLHDNEATVVQGNGAVLKSVAGGEKAYGMVVDFIVASSKLEGAPVELIYPDEGVPVITEPVGILGNTDNEAAAKAFVDFILSEEGQKLSIGVGYTPIREGLAPPEELKGVDELTVLSNDLTDLLKTREEDKEQFRSIFGDE
ncbi:Fe(3+) ABC transporter substrate-binding protein [Salipaludibacillus neizhouensis]|uniref:Fe(3+) ABC transporter substrate-binding protein n=2 Tax=Salipaludibacillus neizhouensis TaxID=885475 RepID=A0A3A9KBF6_9BACI|nr:Fe(3+) ABC transporter substrate-binding protein [Salipaludibacillus neizhouensis]